MTDFLFLLAKINLAIAAGTVMVGLLRRPVRAAFHAAVAYALWLLVPVVALASLLPPRVVTAAAHPDLAARVSAAIPMELHHATQTAAWDWNVVLFAAWALGAGAMMAYLVRQQRLFHHAERIGMAGPAVTGVLRPRIVIPATFTAQFSAPEQAAILAHETVHLQRQDARINAMVALLRCLCWFNPLVHLGVLWFRRDQELACDAAALKHASRVDYANALLKSQMRVLALPLGCAWPASEHPLTERVALLKRRPPARMRALAGAALVLSLTALAGVGAWAAQPPQVGKSFTGMIMEAWRGPKDSGAFFMTLEGDKSGHAVMHFPFGMATADRAHYDFLSDQDMSSHKTITLNGNVTLTTGAMDIRHAQIHGQTLVFDATTGMLSLDGKQIPSGMPKYVPCTKNCKRF